MSDLALFLLGPPRIKRDGEPVEIRRRKAMALVVYLAVTGSSHSRDALATLFWPEHDQSRARAGLRRALAALKKALRQDQDAALGEGWLDVDRETVGLNPGAEIWLDVDEFQDRLAECRTHGHPQDEVCPACLPLLAEAAALYRDDFLAGFTLRDSAAFDEWQFFQTQGLRDGLAGALERLVRCHSSPGEYELTIAYARRWLALDPLHEPAHRHLMQVYARGGQRAAALRQYQECARILEEELGLPPSQETASLYEQIRTRPADREGPLVAAPRPWHNLPVQPTPFVGREAVLAEIADRLQDPDCRLLTLVGPGGIGKTRLALEAAAAQLDNYAHGIWFVSLAPLQSVDAIMPTVADALGFRFYKGDEPQQQLLDYLHQKAMLLILDSFEHLPDGVDLVTEILKTAPEVKILATSRARLNVGGEHRFQITGMDVPELLPKASADAALRQAQDAVQYSAVKLFLQGARRAQPGFDLTDENLGGVVDVCRVVEGMPLAIRLAAAWVEMLSPQEIATEISQGIDFLETDLRDVPARHRSMRAVFDHSWELLTERERGVFQGLSVFRGGFTRQAARQVTGASLRALATLASKSLLQYDQAHDRYQIHELLRQYGADKLGMAPDEESAVHDRHCAYYCAWLEEREAELKGTRQQTALAEIEAETENAQVAWRWVVTQREVGHIDQAMGGLCTFFELRYRYQDGERAGGLAVSALCLERSPEGRPIAVEHQLALAKALAWQSRFSQFLGRMDIASQLLERSTALLEKPALADHDTRAIRVLAPVLRMGAMRASSSGKARFEQNLALYRELGDQLGIANTLCDLGNIALSSGSHDEAKQHFQASLALYRAMGNQWWAATALDGLAWVARGLGNYDQARKLWEESLALSQVQNNPWEMALSLRNLGYLALFQGRFETSARWLEQSVALFREIDDRLGLAVVLPQLGVAYCLSGEFGLVYALQEEALAICQDLGHLGYLANTIEHQAMTSAYAGKYKQAYTQVQKAQALANRLADPVEFDSARAFRTIGWAFMAQEAYAEAEQWVEKSVAAYRTRMDQHSREWLAWSLVALGRAAHGLGNRSVARRSLFEGLDMAVDMGAFIPLLHLIPIVPVVLADAGEIERAVELYALAESHPFVTNSQLFEDIAGRFIEAAAASLPPEVVKAARARGRALDWWDTAAALLEELSEPGWMDQEA